DRTTGRDRGKLPTRTSRATGEAGESPRPPYSGRDNRARRASNPALPRNGEDPGKVRPRKSPGAPAASPDALLYLDRSDDILAVPLLKRRLHVGTFLKRVDRHSFANPQFAAVVQPHHA